MTAPQITANFSDPPSRSDPGTFANKADVFVSQFAPFSTQANALANAVNQYSTDAKAAYDATVATSGATKWAAGSYPAGAVVWFTDGFSYRNTSTASTTATPGNSPWVRLNGGNVSTTGNNAFTGSNTFSQHITVPAGAAGSQAPRASEVVSRVGGAARIPSWTTAGRPSSPSAGDMGYNTTLGKLEVGTNNRWEWQGALQLAVLTLNNQAAVTTNIVAGLSELEIICPAISHNSSTAGGMRLRVGPSAGVLNTGYTSGWQIETTASITAGTSGNGIRGGEASSSAVVSYHYKGRKLAGNLWWFSSACVRADGGVFDGISSYVDVGGDLTTIELALSNGATFDQGSSDAGKAYIYGSF